MSNLSRGASIKPGTKGQEFVVGKEMKVSSFQKMPEVLDSNVDSQKFSVICTVSSVCSSGDWRPYGDFRALNKAAIPDRHPVPLLQDFTASLQGATIFTHIDLVCVALEDIPITAIATPFGLIKVSSDAFWGPKCSTNISAIY